MYNIFKAHIVEDAVGQYWIRVRGTLGWYWLWNGEWWINKSLTNPYRKVEDARADLELLNSNKKYKRVE